MPQGVDAHLIDGLLDALSHHGPVQAEVFESEGQLGFDVLEHELRIRMLKDETDPSAEFAREMHAGVQAADRHPAGEIPARAMGAEPLREGSSGDFSLPDGPPSKVAWAGLTGAGVPTGGRGAGLGEWEAAAPSADKGLGQLGD